MPLPERLSIMDAASIAEAVSIAVEQECGFVVEPRLVIEEPNLEGSTRHV